MKELKSLARLSKGLITDIEPVSGAMVVCDDVVPLPRVDGFRTRTGKTVSALTAASGGDAIAFTDGFLSAWSLSGVQAGVIATKYLAQTDSSSIANTRFVSGSAGSVYVLSSQAANYAGAALTLTGRINRFRSNDNGSAVLMRSELWIPSLDYAAMRYGGAVDDSNVPYSTGTVSGTIATTTLTFGGGANVSTIPIGSYIVSITRRFKSVRIEWLVSTRQHRSRLTVLLLRLLLVLRIGSPRMLDGFASQARLVLAIKLRSRRIQRLLLAVLLFIRDALLRGERSMLMALSGLIVGDGRRRQKKLMVGIGEGASTFIRMRSRILMFRVLVARIRVGILLMGCRGRARSTSSVTMGCMYCAVIWKRMVVMLVPVLTTSVRTRHCLRLFLPL